MKKFIINIILLFAILGNIGVIIHVVSDENFDMSSNQMFLIFLALANLFPIIIAGIYFDKKESDEDMKKWNKQREEELKRKLTQDEGSIDK